MKKSIPNMGDLKYEDNPKIKRTPQIKKTPKLNTPTLKKLRN